MTDADCIHGKTWWECDECEALDPIEVQHMPDTPERRAAVERYWAKRNTA